MEYTIQQLQEMEYNELCSLVQENKITWSQWLEAQPELFEGYEEWLQQQGKVRNDENALAYANLVENEDLVNQLPDGLNERMKAIADAHKAIQL